MGTREHLPVGEARFRQALLIVACLFGVSVATAPTLANAQAPRVQFIHASPYAEARSIDVYRDGELWLDDFGFTEARPLEDWPSRPQTHLAFTFADAPDDSTPFFEQTLLLSPGEAYYVITGGDPNQRKNQPPFELYINKGVHESSPFGAYPAVQAISLVPDAPRFGKYWRRISEGQDEGQFNGRLTTVYPETYHYGQFQGYVPAPAILFEGDVRAELGDVVEPPYPLNLVDAFLQSAYAVPDVPVESGAVFDATVLNFADKDSSAFIIVNTGHVHPRRSGDSPIINIMVMPDGVVELSRPNTAWVQWINNAPYAESEEVDVYINGILLIDNLRYHEATPFMELPSGMVPVTAPTLTVEIKAPDSSESDITFWHEDIKLLWGERYVSVIDGDPLDRVGQPALQIHLSRDISAGSIGADSTRVLFMHGAPDVPAITIGESNRAEFLSRPLRYGQFDDAFCIVATKDDTLLVEQAIERSIIAWFHADFATRRWADTTVVILTSGFVSPPSRIAGTMSDFELVAALPSGGPLIVFGKDEPPGWWLNPWVYLLGLLGLTFITVSASLARTSRLRARERALSLIVEERTSELQKEKKKTEEQAKRLQELDEAKNRFFANISHEFRTPLTLILGPVQDALDGRLGPVDEKLRKQLFLMRRSSRRLLRLVNQLLDLSRLESGDMVLRTIPSDLVAFTRNLTNSFIPAAERDHIDLAFQSDLSELLVDFDPEAMEKILTNLSANALKFTPETGNVLVRLRKADAQFVDIDVKDSGPGIALEDQQRIFERFQQSDTSILQKHEGSGIGLALAKELIELHGGRLHVESEPGKGSMFTVRIPIRTTTDGIADKRGPKSNEYADAKGLEDGEIEMGMPPTSAGVFSGNGAPETRATVLVVEDNADVRALIRDHLGDEWNITEAEDGEAGLKAALEHKPDLIISDVMMPNMDGYEMCRLIRANEALHHVPVIMLTAKATEADTLEGLGSGADDYITKPFSMAELEAKIAHIIETRKELRDRFSREIVVKPADITITPEEEVFLERVIESVNDHLGDNSFSADWLAEEVGLSRRQLDRRVLAASGQTPAELIRQMRLERASQLLRARAGTVSEVAYVVGYRSPAHFSRAFRQAYGVAPSEVVDGESEPDPLA